MPNPKSQTPNPEPHPQERKREGWQGWDAYAPFYDWENARTLGRRDVSFWQRAAAEVNGPVLEPGCGTGRLSLPRRTPGAHGRATFVRGDIRALPFRSGRFAMVLAPYGVLQSLIRER